MNSDLSQKYARLKARFSELGSCVVAFSGGVDSGLLASVAHQVLGERMLAVTVRSPVETEDGIRAAQDLALSVGFAHLVVDYDDLENPNFANNPPDRCYHCKRERLGLLVELANARGFQSVVEGSNADDRGDYRPGKRAVAELGVESPLADIGFTKAEVRALAKELGLALWDRPSAPCLATRFPYGSKVTREGIQQVAQGEDYLHGLGYATVRVRHHGSLSRIEVDADDISRLVTQGDLVTAYFKHLGFTHVAVDLIGYRSGSLNEGITS